MPLLILLAHIKDTNYLLHPNRLLMSAQNPNRLPLWDKSYRPPLHIILILLLKRIKQEKLPTLSFWVSLPTVGEDRYIQVKLNLTNVVPYHCISMHKYPRIRRLGEAFILIKELEFDSQVHLLEAYLDIIQMFEKYGDYTC